MTTPTRYFRADLELYGPLTDAQLERLLGLLAAGAELAGGYISGGWVETDAGGEDVEESDEH
jgi:hypothetical protein